MQPPAIPLDEQARLISLRTLGILNTSSEERFDRLTRLATRLFDVPIALVSLVDENRQWFKSKVGLDASETPRDISFCGHAILGDQLFVVEDASVDPRFYDNPLVVGAPFIRFYVGFPLKSIDGFKLGTLCLIDTKPRIFSDDDREALIDLAGMAEQEISSVQLSMLDGLTQLVNRRGFELMSSKALEYSARHHQNSALIYLDLDDFKQVNDQYGHVGGDQALQVFASALSQTYRDSDILARIGGDEFVVLMLSNHGDQARRAEATLERLESNLQQQLAQQAAGFDVRFSAGLLPIAYTDSTDINVLLDRADKKMYSQKLYKQKNNP